VIALDAPHGTHSPPGSSSSSSSSGDKASVGSVGAAAAAAAAATVSSPNVPFSFAQPPQIAYGWFVPHPPQTGPYLWSCLPPG
jgi:hypothetical protein